MDKMIAECKTVEEVEKLRCFECANNRHWGWCDAPWIICDYKDKIKEILGVSEDRYSSLEEQMHGLI